MARSVPAARRARGYVSLGGFLPVTGAALSALVESATVTLSNLVGSVPLTISGGSYSKNGAAYATAATTVANGDTLKVRVTSAATAGTAVVAVVTINGNGRSFTVTTSAAGGGTMPTLTLGGALTYAADAAAGVTVATIGNVPAGVTPTISPADGRLVIGGDASSGWKVVKGMTASSAGTIAITVSATGATSATQNVTVSAATSTARFAVASTGLNWPIEWDPYGSVPAATGTANVDREYACSLTEIIVTHTGQTAGYLMGGDRICNGGQNTNAWSAGTTVNTFHRIDLQSKTNPAVFYPVMHPANGQPIADGNPYVGTAGGLWALPLPAVPADIYYLRAWDQIPIGGRRTATQNVVAACKVSATPFHTGTGSPPAIGSVAAYPGPSFWHYVDNGVGPAVVLPGDSIENFGRRPVGRLADGPLRHLLYGTANGGPVPVAGNARFGGGPGMFFGPNVGGKDLLSLWSEFGALIGQNDRWLFRQVLLEHFRNGITSFIANTKIGIDRLRAKDPNIQVFGVVPDYYVDGVFVGGATPADGYSSAALQVLKDPDGTTNRQAVIDWYRGDGTTFAEGYLTGIFDADATLRLASPDQHKYPQPGGASGALTADAVAGTTQVIVTNFRPEGLGYHYVLAPNTANMEIVLLSDTVSPVDNGNGTFNCRLAGSGKVTKNQAAGAVALPIPTPDGTHGSLQHQNRKLATPGWTNGKQNLVTKAGAYA